MEIKETAEGVVFKVRAAPNAGKNEITGEHNGMLKIKVAAAPERGKANEELIEYLSGLLKISKSSIKIIKGAASRQKTLSIKGIRKSGLIKLMEV